MFLAMSDLTVDEHEELSQHIYIKVNADIFNLKNLENSYAS